MLGACDVDEPRTLQPLQINDMPQTFSILRGANCRQPTRLPLHLTNLPRTLWLSLMHPPGKVAPLILI